MWVRCTFLSGIRRLFIIRIRAIADLCKLPKRDRLNVISEGLLHIIENSEAIESSACILAQHEGKRGYIVYAHLDK